MIKACYQAPRQREIRGATAAQGPMPAGWWKSESGLGGTYLFVGAEVCFLVSMEGRFSGTGLVG